MLQHLQQLLHEVGGDQSCRTWCCSEFNSCSRRSSQPRCCVASCVCGCRRRDSACFMDKSFAGDELQQGHAGRGDSDITLDDRQSVINPLLIHGQALYCAPRHEQRSWCPLPCILRSGDSSAASSLVAIGKFEKGRMDQYNVRDKSNSWFCAPVLVAS